MHTGWTFVDWLQYLLSFALVIGLLLSLLWSLRKLQNGQMGLRKSDRRLQTLESLSVGPRQKILLLRVDDRVVLVGVTAHQMTALSPWPETAPPLTSSLSTPPEVPPP
ncbi:MAG: flagellar biosynthetic protein FliO [Limnohabitans sp.]|nr:flagellar biosynthetic protein FliO [Limnohabitans sp.]